MSLDLLWQGKVGANLILLPSCVFIIQPSSALLRSTCDVFWAQPWCGTQMRICQPPQPRRAGAGLSLHRGCTSILGEAAAKPGAITTCLKNPSQQRHPKPLLRERLCRALCFQKAAWEAQSPECGTAGGGAALGSHSPCRSERILGSACPPALPLPHLGVCRPSLQGLHAVCSSTGSRSRV